MNDRFLAVVSVALLSCACGGGKGGAGGGEGGGAGGGGGGPSTDGGPASGCLLLPIGPSGARPFVGDPEFDAEGSRVAWQSFSGPLFVAQVDPATGLLQGEPVQAADDVAPLDRTLNGPEWAFSQQGAAFVYTWSEGTSFGLGAVSQSASGAWLKRRIAGREGLFNPRASKGRSDARPLMQFLVKGTSNVGWSTLEDNAPVQVIDNSTDGHWAEGEQLLTYIDRTTKQVMLHDPLEPTRARVLTTDDAAAKARPYMWRAPDFGGRRMLFARVGNDVRVYLERAQAPFVFDTYRVIASPSPSPYNVIASPEPVVRRGRSYLSFMASSTPLEADNVPAEIWLAPIALDGGAPLKLSEAEQAVRSDPEPFDGPGPMFQYYTRVEAPPSGVLSEAALTLYRCTTGL